MIGHTERFTGRVGEYARYRRAYPAEALLRWVREHTGMTAAWPVVDVAAGTGMLTEVWLSHGNPVTAVEPNAEMRAACVTLRERWPRLRVVEGTAEASGLPAGEAAMLTAGRAFHWFDLIRAAAEFRRVLQPDGWVVLVSSGRKRDESERGRTFEALLLEHGTDREYGGRRRLREAGAGVFLRDLGQPASYGRAAFEEARTVGLEEFRGMVQSVSCAPLAGDPRYAGMQRALEAFFARWSTGGTMDWAEECVVEAAQVQ